MRFSIEESDINQVRKSNPLLHRCLSFFGSLLLFLVGKTLIRFHNSSFLAVPLPELNVESTRRTLWRHHFRLGLVKRE